MMFLLMVRVEDPLVPRAIFGILNTLLFFPSGSSTRFRLSLLAARNRQSRSVYLRSTWIQDAPLERSRLVAVVPDMIYLSMFAVVALSIATPLFKRTL